jgi:transcriptional regulator with XRE-family HTH domain
MAPTRLGHTIRRLRKERGLTQVRLAKAAKLGRATVAHLETGIQRTATIPTLRRLASALGVETSMLIAPHNGNGTRAA